MRTAILDPFSGISGDMTLGALLGVGLDADWLRALPSRMGLPDVHVDIREVLRGEIVCWKVDFDIPPQPHGRHIDQIRELVAASEAPAEVRERADRVFWSIAASEGEIHGLPPSEVHLRWRQSVDLALRFGDRPEHAVRALAHRFRHVRRGDELADLIDVTPVRLGRDFEVDLPAHDLAAEHFTNVDAHLR